MSQRNRKQLHSDDFVYEKPAKTQKTSATAVTATQGRRGAARGRGQSRGRGGARGRASTRGGRNASTPANAGRDASVESAATAPTLSNILQQATTHVALHARPPPPPPPPQSPLPHPAHLPGLHLGMSSAGTDLSTSEGQLTQVVQSAMQGIMKEVVPQIAYALFGLLKSQGFIGAALVQTKKLETKASCHSGGDQPRLHRQGDRARGTRLNFVQDTDN